MTEIEFNKTVTKSKVNNCRIAVLTATPRLLNSGMLCVDLALKSLLRDLKLDHVAEFYCFDMPDELRNSKSEVFYQPIHVMPSYDQFDLIIIWGDFIVTKEWIKQICNVLSQRGVYSLEEAKTVVENRVLLKGCEKSVYNKTIIFGQSLMVDGLEALDESEYITQFKKLLCSARFVRFRDPISAYRAVLISGDPSKNYLGVDAALLLSEFTETSNRLSSENRIGIFFYRTQKARLTKLLLAISIKTLFPNYKTKWLPWLKEREHPSASLSWLFGFSPQNPTAQLPDLLQDLQSCKFIIADTYHIALVSWALGVPAICIGNGLEAFKRTIDDKKKEIFYSQHYLSDFYIYNELGWKCFKSGEMSKVLRAANMAEIGHKTRKRIKSIALENVKILSETISNILEESNKNRL